MFNYFANPRRFMKLATVLSPWLAGATIVLAAAGLYLGLFASPADYQQGETVRIMYVHVPAAWMALFCYMGLAISAAVGLIWKHPVADVAARATAPIGACFTFLALLTGSLWGKPMWGAWWVWDARLTSVLVLFFLYLGYMALNSAFDDPQRGSKASAILAMVGLVNVPIIKFSVDWWNTLHQPASIVRMDGPTIHPDMLWPLFLMIGAFTTYYLWVLMLRMRRELTETRLRARRQIQAEEAGA
ncbi:MAG TPA: heme transporter HemC [Rhodospirillaceae bacterium]|nr:heme transporter HemC [Magnetovibrio sp.]HBT41377.1 heme transporter HemC [Rhodospirillaceae bacterium]|tara:strand:+ start:138 stop:869 length:732 start_codon:yes stop_codon:yes gene_type:complete